MSVRFILGRAGSGKTHHCIAAVREALHAEPVHGPRLILLVPEQAALEIERAVTLASPSGVSHRAEVLSFRRLAYRLLDRNAGVARSVLTDPARAMVLRALLAKNTQRLQYYRRAVRLAGFVERLENSIAEFIEEAVLPSDLDFAKRRDVTDPARQAKFADLKLIYEEYLAYLEGGWLDPSQQLEITRNLIGRSDWLREATLFVDGFASFTQQELLTLVELVRVSARADITLLTDPRLTESSGTVDWGTQELFSRTQTAHARVRAMLDQHDISIDSPLRLDSSPRRFTRSPSLAALERGFFASASTATVSSRTTTDLRIVELADRRREVDFAVSCVMEWVRRSKGAIRYRDVAIITRDLEPYHELLAAALESRGVPFFIDRRRSAQYHRLVEFVTGAVELLTSDLSTDAVRALLKTNLLPLDRPTTDLLENYILANGIAGWAAWSEGDWTIALASRFASPDKPDETGVADLALVNEARRVFVNSLESFVTRGRHDERASGRTWSRLLIELIRDLEVGRSLAAEAADAERNGDVEYARACSQVWNDVLSLLDDLGHALADTLLSGQELGDVLRSGMGRLNLVLAPPMLEQVLVGAIERSRHPELKAVVLIGFNDGHFPATHNEDSILNDDDREALRAAGINVRETSRDRAIDEALLAYVALTRASDEAVITYVRSDPNGKPLKPSPYLDAVLHAVPGATVERVQDSEQSGEMWDVIAESDAARRLGGYFRRRIDSPADQAGLHAMPRHSIERWNQLYDELRAVDGAQNPTLLRALAPLKPRAVERLSSESVGRLYGEKPMLSVSQLEAYAACPFKHFSTYALGLSPRREAALEAIDYGSLHHAILEEFTASMLGSSRELASLGDDELVGMLQKSCSTVLESAAHDSVSYARDAYMLRRSASLLKKFLHAQRAIQRAGEARTRAAEVAFGFDRPSSLPALTITTPQGRTVQLRGFIDRVDIAELADEALGIVVDYKRKAQPVLDLSMAYHGLSLQLLAYLLVLAEHGKTPSGRPIRPIAALYAGMTPGYETVDHPDLAPGTSAQHAGFAKLRGLVDADSFESLESGVTGYSGNYSVYMGKQGVSVNIGDALAARDFQEVRNHTRAMLAGLADQLLSGEVAVRPFRLGGQSPCSWCPMLSVCQFDVAMYPVRWLDKVRRNEFVKKISDETSKAI